MPTVERNGASIYYEVHGKGFPILTFAPAGLASTIAVWSQPMAPINPIRDWSQDYQVIVMDQRNATGGRSRAPITAQDGWHSFAQDHIAVLDALGVKKCHLFGQCIGGPFIFSMLKMQPERVASAIIAQSIGRVGPLKPEKAPRFVAWAQSLENHPEVTPEVLDKFYHNLYDPGFVYSVDRDFVKGCKTPCLVLAGNDEAHPRPISDELAQLLPNVEGYITEWKDGPALAEAKIRAKDFLKKNTPAN
jgi:pimeloyl-ACP methyl ester carboxylesterase